METITFEQYNEIVDSEHTYFTLEDLQEDFPDLWDYPLSELDHVLDIGSSFVFVQIGNEVRICETGL